MPYANVRERMLHGTLTTWYENGLMRTKEDYLGGQRHGELLTYYPDGNLKRRDQFVNGRSGVGTCYGPNGAPIPYFAYEQLPLYPGGDAGLIDELTRSLRVNISLTELDALRLECFRKYKMVPGTLNFKVLVELALAEDGRITNAQVVDSMTKILNRAALQSVAKLKRQFRPARRDGQVVASRFVVPITYSVQMQEPYLRGLPPRTR
ncbi:TonB family protein [Hymenobacter humi]|uniref:TonB family protein n=1 Tax=Hymenobacter humi TaxID=1411620 RepID=A0ABW2U9D6_9BACT